MFTFSFSTAFAGTAATDVQKSNLLAAEKLALATAQANFQTAIDEQGDVAYGTYFVVKESVWAELQAELYAEFVKFIEAKTDAQIADYTATATNPSALVDEIYVDNSIGGVKILTVSYINDWLDYHYAVKAAKTQFANDQADALAKLDKVDLNLYSKTTPKTGDTYYEQAAEAVKTAKDTVSAININATDVAGNATYATTDAVKTAYESMSGYVNSIVTPLTIGTTGIASGFYKLSDSSILTIADETTADVLDAATKATLKANVANDYATYVTTPGNDKTKADKAVEMINFLIDEDVVTSVTAGIVNNWISGGYFEENYAEIEELKVFAAKYKAEKDAEGNLVRDAETVDDIVEAAMIVAYGNVYAEYDNTTAKTNIENAVKDATAAYLAFAKEVWKGDIADNRATALKSYYELEQVKVNAAYDKLVAAVDAAEDYAELSAVATSANLTGIATKTDVNALFAVGGKLNSNLKTTIL